MVRLLAVPQSPSVQEEERFSVELEASSLLADPWGFGILSDRADGQRNGVATLSPGGYNSVFPSEKESLSALEGFL